jgi:Mn-dependent DtxR family transcriptional regulator
MITAITRQLSFEDIKTKQKIRYKQILDRLCSGNKTAKEIAVELYELGYIPSTERNYTAPRLTELEKMGYVKVVDKRKCQYTGKQVAVYRMTQAGLEAANMEHITQY